MIFAIVGKEYTARKKFFEEIKKNYFVSRIVERENMEDIISLSEASSLFGDKEVVLLENVGQDKEGREYIKKYSEMMKESATVFIVDEQDGDVYFFKYLSKLCQATSAFVEKKDKPFPHALLNAVEKKDKKNTWLEWIKVRDGDIEPLVGSLWWKVKMIWGDVIHEKNKNFTEEEIAHFGKVLIFDMHKEHKGEGEVRRDIEKEILGW